MSQEHRRDTTVTLGSGGLAREILFAVTALYEYYEMEGA